MMSSGASGYSAISLKVGLVACTSHHQPAYVLLLTFLGVCLSVCLSVCMSRYVHSTRFHFVLPLMLYLSQYTP